MKNRKKNTQVWENGELVMKRQATPIIARTPAQQIAHLDSLLGVGQGAQKERARIAVKLAKSEYGEF